MWKINGRLKQRVSDQLSWMKYNEDDETVVE